MGEEEVQVFGFRSGPFSLRVELALKLKGVHYQHIDEDLLNKKSDLLLKYNPIYKKVPVLVHHGKPISESLLILEYIEETWTENYAILPQHPHQRALARFWAKYIDDKIVPAVQKAARSKEEEREKSIEEAHEALEPLEKELKNKFFGGDKIGFVDIVGLILACWIPATEEAVGFELLSPHKFPNLTKWSQEFVNHSIAKEVLPQKDALVAFLKNVVFAPRN
ncbi:glutathione S-transferase U8-like [Benincasa hispida]|uniref:glutathione S-transferase U8-like n=1 Tax=Benincasa hispida TaxID=102211 RepID=UPI0018FFA514|nr:glutathione S-transferase U8-like [Benincasa hispida]